MQRLKTLLRILAWLLVLAGILLLIIFLAQSVLMYPGQNLGGSNTEFLARLQLVGSRGFQIHDIPGPKQGTTFKVLWLPNLAGTCPAVLWFHGREEDVTELATVGVALKDQGYHVCCMEYPGYGDSGDKVSEEAILARADAAFDWVSKRDDVAGRTVVVGGYELGAAVAVLEAARKRASAVLALAILPDMVTAVGGKLKGLPVGFLLKDRFEIRPVLGDLTVPVLFVHGAADPLVPPEKVDALRSLARQSRVIRIEGVGRFDLQARITREQWDEIGTFLTTGR